VSQKEPPAEEGQEVISFRKRAVRCIGFRRPITIPKQQITQAADRERVGHLSSRAYRLDNRKHADQAKESDEQEVTPHRHKTATKRSERREDD
jgi:hypothetical protein